MRYTFFCRIWNVTLFSVELKKSLHFFLSSSNCYTFFRRVGHESSNFFQLLPQTSIIFYTLPKCSTLLKSSNFFQKLPRECRSFLKHSKNFYVLLVKHSKNFYVLLCSKNRKAIFSILNKNVFSITFFIF